MLRMELRRECLERTRERRRRGLRRSPGIMLAMCEMVEDADQI